MLKKHYEVYRYGIIRECHKFDTLAEALEYKRTTEANGYIVSPIETKWRFKREKRVEHGLRNHYASNIFADLMREVNTRETDGEPMSYDEFECRLLGEVLV